METEENQKKLRHSIKHHLAAIRILLVNQEQEAALSDLNTILDKLSEDVSSRLCSNPLVNATAMHYQVMVRQAGIETDICLDIPEDIGCVLDSELCVIVGDLLENAVAACRETENPFLKMRSRCADGILTITLDNSYSYVHQNTDGSFQSTRDDGGLGLKVISAIEKKHAGGSPVSMQKTGCFILWFIYCWNRGISCRRIIWYFSKFLKNAIMQKIRKWLSKAA